MGPPLSGCSSTLGVALVVYGRSWEPGLEPEWQTSAMVERRWLVAPVVRSLVALTTVNYQGSVALMRSSGLRFLCFTA